MTDTLKLWTSRTNTARAGHQPDHHGVSRDCVREGEIEIVELNVSIECRGNRQIARYRVLHFESRAVHVCLSAIQRGSVEAGSDRDARERVQVPAGHSG